jgi:hypothetical protein
MGIYIFYILAAIPVGIGAIMWCRSREVCWQEWVGGSAAGFILAIAFHLLSISGMTGDTETWSGQIVSVTHHPRWVEEYQQMHTRTVSCGKDCTTTEIYYTTEYRTHPEYWSAATSIPNDHDISLPMFLEIRGKLGGFVDVEQPHKSGFYSGDRNVYVTRNRTGYIYPVTAKFSFENRIKAAPTLFSFAKVPTNVTVYAYPENNDWMKSDRLIGTARATIDLTEFDRMNARLGPRKKVNVIMVGFGNRGIDAAEWQRCKWIGGKKNDLVLCYGGLNVGKPTWSKVFGWSDGEICKRNLETILLQNEPSTTVLPKIEAEIIRGYKIKDWSAFDYITIEPPTWSYWVFAIVLCVAQAGFWYWAHRN